MQVNLSTPQAISHGLVLLMATATGIAVASNYYAQPLLQTIALTFDQSQASVGNIVTTAQLSYGLGLLLLVPLADIQEKKRLIVLMMLLACSGLLISGFAPNLFFLLLGTALTGVCSVVAQVLVPFAATLADPKQRGRVIGIMMSGLLLGILLARVFAGGLSTLVNWRLVYWVAALALFIVTVALAHYLPRSQNDFALSYKKLLSSTIKLFVDEPVLRYRSLLGMISFMLFSMFWTPLAFLLSHEPYRFSDATIGLFGMVGVAGVMAASLAGRLADSGKGRHGTIAGLLALLISWLPLYFATNSLMALIVGVLILDLAVQLIHVSNQNVIYALQPDIRNRLNAGYMTCYFIGGAVGSALSVNLYQHVGWTGVCAAGAMIALLGIMVGQLEPAASKTRS